MPAAISDRRAVALTKKPAISSTIASRTTSSTSGNLPHGAGGRSRGAGGAPGGPARLASIAGSLPAPAGGV